jgi:hypothetical protein
MAGKLAEKWRTSRYLKGSFTCRKAATWDRRLYFPSEGRHAEDFFALKNPTASAGFEPARPTCYPQTTEAAYVFKLIKPGYMFQLYTHHQAYLQSLVELYMLTF